MSGLLGLLVGLALVDSTSFGTLGIPLVLVVANRRVLGRPLAVYFGTVVIFYFLVGVALVLGLGAVFGAFGDALESDAAYWLQLVLGVGLFVVSFRIGGGKQSKGKQRRSWMPASLGTRAMVGIALTATLIEVGTMLPYLGAIGLLSASELGVVWQLLILAGYCLFMILPALVLIGAASLLGDRVWSRLERLSTWMQRHSEDSIGWIIGILGFFLAANALEALFG